MKKVHPAARAAAKACGLSAGPESRPSYLAETPEGGLAWGPLTEGRLVRRYQRFLADVEMAGGEIITAHTANTGRMLGCCEPGRRVWLSEHDNPKRRCRFSLEMIEMPSGLVGVNTMVPNRLAARAAELGLIEETGGPVRVEREVQYGRSRLDLRLSAPGRPEILVEVKNCTLAEKNVAYFPDAVTERGAKHLDELRALAGGPRRAAILILVQRGDAASFSPADHLDPHWGRRLRLALASGVEIWIYQVQLSLQGLSLGPSLPLALGAGPRPVQRPWAKSKRACSAASELDREEKTALASASKRP